MIYNCLIELAESNIYETDLLQKLSLRVHKCINDLPERRFLMFEEKISKVLRDLETKQLIQATSEKTRFVGEIDILLPTEHIAPS